MMKLRIHRPRIGLETGVEVRLIAGKAAWSLELGRYQVALWLPNHTYVGVSFVPAALIWGHARAYRRWPVSLAR